MDEIVASGDVCISDADHDDQEESQEETQSKSAEELLSTMVVGVSSCCLDGTPYCTNTLFRHVNVT